MAPTIMTPTIMAPTIMTPTIMTRIGMTTRMAATECPERRVVTAITVRAKVATTMTTRATERATIMGMSRMA